VSVSGLTLVQELDDAFAQRDASVVFAELDPEVLGSC
jgi:hypothetical protein